MSIDVEALAQAMDAAEEANATAGSIVGRDLRMSDLAEAVAIKYAEYARLVPAEDEGRPIDYLAEKDRSAAEHSDTRSACPRCGEWRDSPTSDCAACGFVPAEDEGRLREAAQKLLDQSVPPDAQMDETHAGQELRSWWLDRFVPARDALRATLATTPEPWTDPKG